MLGSAARRPSLAPGGVLAGPWVRNELWRRARAVPSLDLRFADNKSLVDATTGQNLVTFTRASSGTYVDSDGLIKTATTNLLLRSEEFGTTWSTVDASITPDTTTAPNGTVTADKLIENTVNATHRTSQSVAIASPYTLSCSFYAKAGERSRVGIWFRGASSTNRTQVTFNLSTGLTSELLNTGLFSGGVASMTAVGDGWYRCSLSANCAAGETAAQVTFYLMNNTVTISNATYIGDGASGLYLWGAQLEQSSTVGEYIPTTSTINSAPRFDHNPTTGESLGLLVEEQRTNLLQRSEDLTTTWIQFGTSVSSNVATAPDGTLTADKLNDTASTGEHGIYQITTTSGSHTFSVFAKAVERRYIILRKDSGPLLAVFDLQTGTVTQTDAGVTASITAYPSGWYRCSMTCTSTGNTVVKLSDVGTGVLPNSGYLGNGGGVFLWGAQLEAGAFPTSYIPTTTAAATRSADVASISGSNFSSWYRQDEGTVFAETQIARQNALAGAAICGIETGVTNTEAIYMHYRGSGLSAFNVYDGSVIQADFSPYGLAVPANTLVRQAVAIKLNDMVGIGGGVGQTTDTVCTVPTPDRMLIGFSTAANNYLSGTIRRLTYWPQRLANNVLQTITQ